MPTSKKAVAKYNAKTYDQIQIRVPKDHKEKIKAHAQKYQPSAGEVGTVGYVPQGSLNGFVNRAIDEAMERDTKGGG